MQLLDKRRIKEGARVFARRALGLDIHWSRSRRYDLHLYEHDYRELCRVFYFRDLLEEVSSIEGSIVECGVGSGSSLFAFSSLLLMLECERSIWAFDSFEGLPGSSSQDIDHESRNKGMYRFSKEHVIEQLHLNGIDESFISNNITFVAGDFTETLSRYDETPISILHIDADLYLSYITVLDALYEMVARGGIIAFDEYRHYMWPGATQAVNEFFAGRSEVIVKSPIVDKYYTIKC